MTITSKDFETALDRVAMSGDVKLLSEAYFSAQGTDQIKVEKALLKAIDTLRVRGMDMEIFENIIGVRMPDKAMQKGAESLARLGAALPLLNIIRNQNTESRMKALAQKSLPKSICMLEKKEKLGYLIDLSVRRDLDPKMLKSIEMSCISVVGALGKAGKFSKIRSAINNRNSTMAIKAAAEKEMNRKKYYSEAVKSYLTQKIVQDKSIRFNGKNEAKARVTLPS